MKTIFLPLVVGLSVVGSLQAEDAANATALADAVFQASGGPHWAGVKSIDFVFHVGQGDKVLLEARHHWDVQDGTDTVTWSGKTITVNVWNPASDADSKAAYQRWVNDSYWLLAPLKLKDPGVHLTYQGLRGYSAKSPFAVDAKTGEEKFEALHLAFGKVGLTSSDEYEFFIDPKTHLVRHWVYMPSPEKQIAGDWDDYREFGGLNLSLERPFGDKRIWFTGVEVN